MKPVPRYLRVPVKNGQRVPGWLSWAAATGAVYLLRCQRTGEYKYGGSINPAVRIATLISQGHSFNSRDLDYVWSIATNGVGRLELYWAKRWDRFRINGRREWVSLPPDEVAEFRSRLVVNWANLPQANAVWLECVRGPYRGYPAGRPRKPTPAPEPS